MLITPGPKRLIMIRAGRYDYADVVLGSSTHLVGPNNVGKTSLIATVQFLYIAAFNEMKFSRAWDESVRYYFSDDTSTILFETATSDGRFVTMGLRGRGQLGGYQVDRFAFEGAYRRDDFLTEENRVRDFSEVKARLVGDRFFKLLEPSDIRAAVVGDYTAVPALNMGIVPLKNPARYGDFIFLLKNLLRLNSLSQQDIKLTLLNVYRHELQTTEIDLHGTYADVHAKLTAERLKLENLRKVAQLAVSLKLNRAKRDRARRDLPAMYVALVGAKARAQTALLEAAESAEARRTKLDQEDEASNAERHRLEEENTQIVSDLTRAQDWVKGVEDEGKALEGFLPDLAKQERANLASEIESLTAKVALVRDPEVIEAQLNELDRKLKRTVEQREKHANLLGTRLQEHLGPSAMSDLGRVFHSSLLRLPVEPGAVEITDEPMAVAALKGLHSAVSDGHLRAIGLDVTLDRIAGANSVSVPDIGTLDAEIAKLTLDIAETTTSLNDARNVVRLRDQRKDLSDRLKAAEALALRYEQWLENNAKLPGKKQEAQRLTTDQQKNAAARKALDDAGKKRVELRLAIKTEVEAIAIRQKELTAIRPVPVDPTWPVGAEDPEWLSIDVKSLHLQYEQTHSRYTEASQEVMRVLNEAEVVCQDGFPGDDQDARIDALVEAVDSLPEHERSFRDQLGYVIKGMRASFNNMFKAFKDLTECVAEFNRSIGKVAISNITLMQLELFENVEVTRHYRNVAVTDLLEDADKTEEAIRVIASTIENTRILKLSDWFGVRFVITTTSGETRRYDDITTLESNGTTIAIKVLVNIVLIRAMMRKNKSFSIPFYIDEATQIDEANLKEIVALANEKGFCPVLASTVPASVAENIDFVRRAGNSRAVIDPKWRINRQAKTAEHANGA